MSESQVPGKYVLVCAEDEFSVVYIAGSDPDWWHHLAVFRTEGRARQYAQFQNELLKHAIAAGWKLNLGDDETRPKIPIPKPVSSDLVSEFVKDIVTKVQADAAPVRVVPQRIDPQKVKKIQEMLIDGQPSRKIMEELQVSARTVRRQYHLLLKSGAVAPRSNGYRPPGKASIAPTIIDAIDAPMEVIAEATLESQDLDAGGAMPAAEARAASIKAAEESEIQKESAPAPTHGGKNPTIFDPQKEAQIRALLKKGISSRQLIKGGFSQGLIRIVYNKMLEAGEIEERGSSYRGPMIEEATLRALSHSGVQVIKNVPPLEPVKIVPRVPAPVPHIAAPPTPGSLNRKGPLSPTKTIPKKEPEPVSKLTDEDLGKSLRRCQAQDCTRIFTPERPDDDICPRCRQEKRPKAVALEASLTGTSLSNPVTF